jgi:Protein of unknown function (DUF4232)
MQGATGGIIGGVRLRDTGHDACTLTGIPTPTLVARGGTEIPARLDRTGNDLLGQPRWAHYPLVSLRPGQGAVVLFTWREYCGRARLGAVRLKWRGQAVTVPVTTRGAPECNPPSARSSLTVGRFQPDQSEAPPPPVQVPLRVDIAAPATGRPGRRISYRVTLTNESKHTVRLRRCPAYWQGLATDARRVTEVRRARVLNCGPTPTIPPRGQFTYAMEWTIPISAPAGANALAWVFEPVGAGGTGKTALRIIRDG